VIPIVTVINNGGPLPEKLGVRVVTMHHNAGYAGAANHALRLFMETGEAFCVIGAHDLHVHSTTLARLVSAAGAHRDFGVLGPELREHGTAIAHTAGVTERDWVSGTCLLIRRSCLEDVGDFDERFGSYTEDVDFCERARSCGWRVGTVDGAVAYGLGSREPRRAERLMHANHALLDAKHHRWALVARRFAGLARRCISDPRRSPFWAATLLLAAQRVATLATSPVRTAVFRAIHRATRLFAEDTPPQA
jgi:N-acetylglucosaminyl-diphospho-decaprenol L-rhamnosyltransferase